MDLNFFEYGDPLRETPEEKYERIVSKPLLSGKDLLDLPYQPNDYLIENFLWRHSICAIIAKEKVGKTIFATQMALALTSGEHFLGQYHIPQPTKILYVQTEGTIYDTRENISNAIKDGKIKWNPDNWRHLFCPSIPLDTDEGRNLLISKIDDATNDSFRPQVIFIDPLYMAMRGGLSKDEPSRAFCGNIRQIHERYGCAFVINHHEHRAKRDNFGGEIKEGDDSIHGSFVWKAFPSHILRLERNQKTKIVTVSCKTSRNANVVEEVKMSLCQDPLMFEVLDSGSDNKMVDIVYRTILESDKLCRKDICDKTGYADGSVGNMIVQLAKSGKITRCGVVNRNVYYKAVKKEGDHEISGTKEH